MNEANLAISAADRGVAMWLSIPIAAFIGTIGAVSVYVDKRDLKCACVGGASKMPLGFVSLTENVMMVAMAGWMLWRMISMNTVSLPITSASCPDCVGSKAKCAGSPEWSTPAVTVSTS